MNATLNTTAAAAAQITIVQRGGTKRAELIEGTVRCAIAHLFPPTMTKAVRIRVEMRTDMGKGMGRNVGGWAKRGGKNTDYTIRLRRDCSTTSLLRMLMHEMVHVAQFHRGSLVMSYCFTRKAGIGTWNGSDVNMNETPYFQQPWEVEAYGTEDALVAKFWTAPLARATVNADHWVRFVKEAPAAPAPAPAKASRKITTTHRVSMEERIAWFVGSIGGYVTRDYIVRSFAADFAAACAAQYGTDHGLADVKEARAHLFYMVRNMVKKGTLVQGNVKEVVTVAK